MERLGKGQRLSGHMQDILGEGGIRKKVVVEVREAGLGICRTFRKIGAILRVRNISNRLSRRCVC